MSDVFYIRKSRVRHLIWGPTLALATFLIFGVVSNVFAIDPELYTDRGARTALNLVTTLMVFASCGVFFLALKISRRFAISTAEEVLSWDNRKPVLYLRTFEDDKQMVREDPKADALKWANPVLLVFQGVIGSVRFEEKLLAVCEQVGPFIGLGHPTDRNEDYSGAARLSPFGDEWKDVVLDLMDKSAAIIVRATSREGEGMLWELDQIAFHELASKTVLYIEFNASDDDELRRLRYDKYANMIRDRYGVSLPPFHPINRFIYTPEGGEVWSDNSAHLSDLLSKSGHPAENNDGLPLWKSAAPGASWLKSRKVSAIADAQPTLLKSALLVLFGLAFGAALGFLKVGLEGAMLDQMFDYTLNAALDGVDVNVDGMLFGMLAILTVFFPLAIIGIGVLVGWVGGWLRLPGTRAYVVAGLLAVLAFYHAGYDGFIWSYFTTGPDLEILDELGMPVLIYWMGVVLSVLLDLLAVIFAVFITLLYRLSMAERDIAASWMRGDVFLDEPLNIPRA